MLMKEKERYSAPEVAVLEMENEGVICASGLNNPSDYPGGVDPFNF